MDKLHFSERGQQMIHQGLMLLQRLSPIQGILTILRNANAYPENYGNLATLSYEEWRNRFLQARLNLAFRLVLAAYLTSFLLKLARFFYAGETFFDKYLAIQLIGLFSLCTALGVLQTNWGRRHLNVIFLGLSWSLEMNEQIIESLFEVLQLGSTVVNPDLMSWGSTFFTQATLIPACWPLHLLSQVITLGYYFGINRILGFDTIPLNYNEPLRLILTLFWICLICDLSVYLYERLQRAEFNARQKLEIAEAKYRNIFENAVEGLFQSTPEGRFLDVNKTLARIFGYQSPQEMMAKISNIGSQMYVDPQRRAEFIRFIEEQGCILAFESQVYHADGHIIWISENGRAVRDAANNIIVYEGDIEEITERKQAEAEMRKALQKEKELNLLKSRFVSMISHEFRTPLTTIMAATEALEYYGHRWTDEKKNKYFHRIQVTIQHLTDLLNDVLVIGQSEAHKLPYNPTPLDLDSFCQNLVEEIQLNAGSEHQINLKIHGKIILNYLEFELDKPSPLLPLFDEKLLRHILVNLLSNAVKYSPKGGPIDFKLFYQKKQVVFVVKDQGIGIPPEDKKHLFESFHRARNVATIPGTGLGLAIVKRSVDRLEGRITVHSEVGKGTIFTVALPLHFQERELNETDFSY
ncbi:MAG: ATP-binding protein [Cyanobacteria bacterium J06592_8]